ncbi:hypothetical protein CCACVL1_25383, partial [Corchorus capsularis]
MAELPLEPSLSRTLIEANEDGCLSQALTIVAMLSAETNLLPGRSKSNDKKRKHPSLELPDGSGFSDHIQFLQIYEWWNESDYDIGWCKDHELQRLLLLKIEDYSGKPQGRGKLVEFIWLREKKFKLREAEMCAVLCQIKLDAETVCSSRRILMMKSSQY